MRAARRFFTRAFNFAAGRQRDERLREEIATHLALQAEENVRAGMAPDEARRRARMKFGSVETVREGYRAEAGLPFVETVLRDFRYAMRVLRKSPAFTMVAVVTLMLGIGANVVVFGVLNAVLLRPLAVSDPASLYQLRHRQWMKGRLLTTSYPALLDFRRRATGFSGLAGINGYSHAALRWRNAVTNVSGDEVTGNYFDLLGVQPALGRYFHEADEHGSNSVPYVVLSDGLWRRAFQGDRSVIGATVELNKHPFTVVGVAPVRFHGTERLVWPQYWIPMANEEQVAGSDYLQSRASVAVTVIGRLKPGVTARQATENLNAVAAELGREYPESDDGQPLRLIHPGLLGDEGDVIRGFLVSVNVLALLVLAAACANLATLFAARASDRSRELALRMALGSTRRRLAGQLLTEAAVVSLTGGGAGLAGAGLLLEILNHWDSPYGRLEVSVDARVYFAAMALSLGSALLFGMIPVRQALGSSPLQTMKSEPADAMHVGRFALRDILLGAQIAICTLLVTASLVAVRGMVRALDTPLGFKPRGAMLVDVDLSQVEQTSDVTLVKQKAMLEAARNVPGVTAAGAVSRTPMTGGMRGVPVFRPGTTQFKIVNAALAPFVFAMSPGYLDAAGTRLLSGRDVRWSDTTNAPFVSIVNETFAEKMWGRLPAVGQQFVLRGKLTEVVGVTEDGKYHDLQEAPQPVVWVPMSQWEEGEAVFAVRSRRTSSEMQTALREAFSSIEPDVPVTVENWIDSLDGELFPAEAATAALGVMGLLAAMLAATGIFGMAAYSVSRRMKELGIRVALGARRTQVMRAAVGRPMMLLGLGSLSGLAAGLFASRLLGQIVYGADTRDPVVLGGAALMMMMLGVGAAAIPARRALAVDPSRLMREE